MPINYIDSVEKLLAPLEAFVVANPRTLAGEVIPEHVNASFATPGGNFPVATCRSYRHAASGLRMLIGTRVSTKYALMIRVLGRREEQAPNTRLRRPKARGLDSQGSGRACLGGPCAQDNHWFPSGTSR